MLEIKGSVAVITGGASGIGLALAKHWVQHGGKVIIGGVVTETLNGDVFFIHGEIRLGSKG